MIADVITRNPNVFYELVIAHTIGREVIIISQNKDDVPFDIQNLKYYLYNIDHEYSKENLREDLRNLVKNIKPKDVNPYFMFPGSWWQTYISKKYCHEIKFPYAIIIKISVDNNA